MTADRCARSVRRRRGRCASESWHIVFESEEKAIYVGMAELTKEERWL